MAPAPGSRLVFLRDLTLPARIGIHPHEHAGAQRVRINVTLSVPEEGEGVGPDRLARVVDYEAVAIGIRALVAAGHVNLVETLAERIAGVCLTDPRVASARIRVEKLDVFPDAFSAGVEIVRTRR